MHERHNVPRESLMPLHGRKVCRGWCGVGRSSDVLLALHGEVESMHGCDHVVVECSKEVGEGLRPFQVRQEEQDGPRVGDDPRDKSGVEECLRGMGGGCI